MPVYVRMQNETILNCLSLWLMYLLELDTLSKYLNIFLVVRCQILAANKM